MNSFINRFGASIRGVISGFDRLVFRGYFQPLLYAGGLLSFLSSRSVLLKDFLPWTIPITDQIRKDFTSQTERIGQKVEYVRSPSLDSETTYLVY